MRINVLKTFHKYAKDNLTDIFLNLPNYENFLKAKHKSLPFIELCINYLLNKNRSKNNVVHFVDSIPVTVSLNHHIYTHKVAKDIAKRGKSTKGWFYGFKLHEVCNEKGKLEALLFTSGNVCDSSVFNNLTKGLKGNFFADVGYLQKADILEELEQSGRILNAATRKNMKRLLTIEQYKKLCKKILSKSVGDN